MDRQLLLRTPDPNQNEGIFGHLLRVSEANRYDSPWHVLAHAGYAQGEMITAAFSVEKFAAVLGKDASTLARHAYIGQSDEGHPEYRINGQSLGRGLNHSPFRLMRPQICPSCVKKNGQVDVCWDLSAFVACPSHGTRLVGRCSACKSALSWFRPELLKCSCGAELASELADQASSAVLSMMEVIQAKVHGEAVVTIVNRDGLPLDHLSGMPLETMLRVISILGKLVAVEGDQHYGRIAAAANAFAQWPTGFYEYLRRMANEGIAASVEAVGLRKRFAPLYQALFKARVKLVGVEFLRDEFVKFGLEEWGEAAVDKKLLRGEQGRARYLSGKGMARLLGVQPITVKRWIKLEKIPGRTVAGDRKVRYVADASVADEVERSDSDRLQAREAGKLAGLPVSALRELKANGRYSKCPIANNMRGYWSSDLQALKQRLLATVGTNPSAQDRSQDVTVVSLDRILRFWKLGSTEAKGAFLADVLDGRTIPTGKVGNTSHGLLFNVSDVEAFRVRYAIESSRKAVSGTAAANMLGCSTNVVAALVRSGHLRRDGDGKGGIGRSSVEEFSKSWHMMSALAKELGTSTPSLIARAEALGVCLHRVRAHRQYATPYISETDVLKLKTGVLGKVDG